MRTKFRFAFNSENLFLEEPTEIRFQVSGHTDNESGERSEYEGSTVSIQFEREPPDSEDRSASLL